MRGLVHLHGSRLLLFLNLLGVSGLKGQNSVEIETGLDFDKGSVAFGVGGNLRNGGRSKGGSAGRVSIGSLDGKGVFPVERQDFSGRNGVALGKDLNFGIVIGIGGDGLPLDLDGIVVDIVNGKVANAEDGGKHGTSKGGTTGDGLVLVQGEGELLATKGMLDSVAKGGDTC